MEDAEGGASEKSKATQVLQDIRRKSTMAVPDEYHHLFMDIEDQEKKRAKKKKKKEVAARRIQTITYKKKASGVGEELKQLPL